MMRAGTAHLTAIAKDMKCPWDPKSGDPRQIHNMYARNLICAYVSKFADLSASILYAIENSHFLTYALCGRALIESTATLRYYVLHKYKPLFDKGTLDPDGFRQLIEIDDLHLRGSRFDWESFFGRDFSKLKEDVLASLKDRKNKSKAPTGDQINVFTCVTKWAAVAPEVQIAYDLFCDLVHPNIGSTFLVASTDNQNLYFSRFHGEPVGSRIVAQTLPILLSVTQKPFGEFLFMLIATIYGDDEFAGT